MVSLGKRHKHHGVMLIHVTITLLALCVAQTYLPNPQDPDMLWPASDPDLEEEKLLEAREKVREVLEAIQAKANVETESFG